MGGITLEDCTQSVAYREIFGLGEERGREQGHQTGEAGHGPPPAPPPLRRPLSRARDPLRALPLPRLEALADALLDFQGPEDLNAWLAQG